eukprot:355549-Chlamydomonas_euryale.AAC.1
MRACAWWRGCARPAMPHMQPPVESPPLLEPMSFSFARGLEERAGREGGKLDACSHPRVAPSPQPPPPEVPARGTERAFGRIASRGNVSLTPILLRGSGYIDSRSIASLNRPPVARLGVHRLTK